MDFEKNIHWQVSKKYSFNNFFFHFRNYEPVIRMPECTKKATFTDFTNFTPGAMSNHKVMFY